MTEISEITRCSRTSLMEWCQKYLEQEPGGLVDHRLDGNSRKLTPEKVADLKERLHQYSPQAVIGSGAATAEGRFSTVEDLQRAIQNWYGVNCQSRTSCLTLFARCGFSYQRPARVFKSRRAADVAALEETVEITRRRGSRGPYSDPGRRRGLLVPASHCRTGLGTA